MQMLDAYETSYGRGDSAPARACDRVAERRAPRRARAHRARVGVEHDRHHDAADFENVSRAGTGPCAAAQGATKVVGKTGTVLKLGSQGAEDPGGHFATFAGFAAGNQPAARGDRRARRPGRRLRRQRGRAGAEPDHGHRAAADADACTAGDEGAAAAVRPVEGLGARETVSRAAVPSFQQAMASAQWRAYAAAHPTTTTTSTTTAPKKRRSRRARRRTVPPRRRRRLASLRPPRPHGPQRRSPPPRFPRNPTAGPGYRDVHHPRSPAARARGAFPYRSAEAPCTCARLLKTARRSIVRRSCPFPTTGTGRPSTSPTSHATAAPPGRARCSVVSVAAGSTATTTLAQAVAAGAVALVSEHRLRLGVPNVVVRSTAEVAGGLAASLHGHPWCVVLGVTGTNGKTTTTYLLEAILANVDERVGVIGTVENPVGHPSDNSCAGEPRSPLPTRANSRPCSRGCEPTACSGVAMEVSSHSWIRAGVLGCEFTAACSPTSRRTTSTITARWRSTPRPSAACSRRATRTSRSPTSATRSAARSRGRRTRARPRGMDLRRRGHGR